MSDHYEDTLALLYLRVAALHDAHPSHPIADSWCKVDNVCDPLNNEVYVAFEDTFREQDAALWLRFGPNELLDWDCSGGLCPDLLRDAVRMALRIDAEERIFPDYSCAPVNPVTTTDAAP